MDFRYFSIALALLLALLIAFSGCNLPQAPVCGNGVCESPAETELTCASDCAVPQPTGETSLSGKKADKQIVTNSLSSCQTLSTPNTTYTLGANITGTTGQPCFIIAASGITLEGLGLYTITNGNIVINNHFNNNTIKNITLQNGCISG